MVASMGSTTSNASITSSASHANSAFVTNMLARQVQRAVGRVMILRLRYQLLLSTEAGAKKNQHFRLT
jgi:hypothetical protein